MSDNVGIKHLLNYKHILVRQENMMWFRVPPVVFFKGGCLGQGLRSLYGKQRAFIVTDKSLFDLGYTDAVTHILDGLGIHHEVGGVPGKGAGGGWVCDISWRYCY